jgi:hypothetical protein
LETVRYLFETLKTNAHFREALELMIYLVVGGGIGLFLRALYLRFGTTISNRNNLSSNFPILIITTVLVIFVVKSSLALSLGLVGALSIVRFRAAIKEPEELVFLFFCIAIGLALGAEYPELAIGAVLIFTLFVMIRHANVRNRPSADTLLLTIVGSRQSMLDGNPERLVAAVRDTLGRFTVQRLDVEDGRVQFRALVSPDRPEKLVQVIESLRSRLPDCNVSYVNMANLL